MSLPDTKQHTANQHCCLYVADFVGFWDDTSILLTAISLQKLFFSLSWGLQAVLGWSIIPLRMGESLIVMAEKA